MAYGPAYFDRFDADLAGIDLPEPTSLTPFDDPELDEYDALLQVASDYGHVTLSVEEALKGELEELNGIDVEERSTGSSRCATAEPDSSAAASRPTISPVSTASPTVIQFRTTRRCSWGLNPASGRIRRARTA